VKGVKKQILALGKTVPDFEGYAPRISAAVHRSIRLCGGDEKELVKRLQCYYLHYQDDHTKCDHIPQQLSYRPL